jgi:uncharacterized damage-inducible protein DinB
VHNITGISQAGFRQTVNSRQTISHAGQVSLEGAVNQNDVLLLYAYNAWANRQILDAAAQVTPEQFLLATADSHGSLRGILVHAFDAEYGWRMLLQHGTLAFGMDPATFPTVADLALRWEEEAHVMQEYVTGLSDESLAGTVHYTTDTGLERTRVLWHCLWHIVNHGTQHRGEAATLLTNYGHSPGELDFTVFLNDQGAQFEPDL